MAAKMIVGVDGSDISRRALIWASRMAAGRGVVVDPVLSWHYPATISTALGDVVGPRLEDLDATGKEQLESLLSGTREFCHPETTITDGLVAQGAPGAVLCDLAVDAELLVVGSRGHGGFKGLALGSVSSHCANAAPCPVAVIPAEWDPDRVAGVVVVGVDGSENSDAAVEWADHWAPPDAVVRLVHCWTYPPAYDANMFDYDPGLLQRASDEILTEAERHAKGHRTETVSIHGDARHMLRVYSGDADMLVIGARGRSGVARLLVGSVASATVHGLTVPTVLVRPGSTT
jgi:nucleotide-binding universal stress UspA family protein